MNLLLIGDIIGEPGRKTVAKVLPGLKHELHIDYVQANVENLAAGFGVTVETVAETKKCGVDVFTSGNHIWDKKQYADAMRAEPCLLRPANYPEGAPGKGSLIFNTASGVPVGVLNLSGRVYINALDCPFKAAKRELANLKAQGARVVVVDFHAEATSEKTALFAYLDGEATALAGTHTHVPTADARVTPAGSAVITDLGMTGPYDSVIGIEKSIIIKKFLDQVPSKYEVAKHGLEFWAVLVEADDQTGKALSITQVRRKVDS